MTKHWKRCEWLLFAGVLVMLVCTGISGFLAGQRAATPVAYAVQHPENLQWTVTPGVTVPYHVTRVIDGDTVEGTVTFTLQCRLIDCWAPERNAPGGPEATEALEDLALGQWGVLAIPLTGKHLGQATNMSRFLGYVTVTTDTGAVVDLSREMVNLGHAEKSKPAQ